MLALEDTTIGKKIRGVDKISAKLSNLSWGIILHSALNKNILFCKFHIMFLQNFFKPSVNLGYTIQQTKKEIA